MPDSEFLEAFGLSVDEMLEAHAVALGYLNSARARIAFLELWDAASEIDKASRDLLHANAFKILSRGGYGALVSLGGDGNPALQKLEGYVRHCLSDPAAVSDLSVWALFFACRAASDSLQIDHSRAPTSESHLSGELLGAIEAGCERWRKVVNTPLERYGSTLFLHKIDLSILGGEQETGGDFGIVIDLDGNSVQPGDDERSHPRHRKITPFIFQAKRYTRPNVDVSQHHWDRGYQRHVLGRNDCASAYIFYENGTSKLERTLPPIVKPVEAIGDGNRTSAIKGGYEFATYIVTHLINPDLAPRAGSPDEALRMIYAKGQPSQLAVISSDQYISAQYEAEFARLAKEIIGDSGEEGILIHT